MEEKLTCYIDAFRRMNRANVRGFVAPHKPVLLLAIMSQLEEGKLTTNRIILSKDLIAKFAWIWSRYVDDGNQRSKMMVADGLELEIVRNYPFKCNIANPFYHMEHEPFWRLVKSEAFVKRTDYNLKALQTSFEYAEIDEDLFSLFLDTDAKERLRNVLLDMI